MTGGSRRRPENSSGRSVRGKLLIWSGSLILALGLIEGVLLLLKLPLPDRFFVPNQDFGWFHIPGRSGWQRTPELAVPISINQHGLRDSEHTYEKAEGTYRILLLGDSFVEGLQVPLEQTVGKQLEARLISSAKGVGYDVINGGVSRFGTDNEILFYDYLGSRYDPDRVILFFFYNDLYDNLEEPYFRLSDGGLEPVTPKPVNVLGPAGEVRGWLWDRFQVYRLLVVVGSILGLADPARPTAEGKGNIPFLLEDAQDEAAAIRLTAALLEEFDERLRSEDRRLLVVGIGEMSAIERPAGTNPSPTEAINRKLGEALVEGGVEYLDLIPGFRSRFNESGSRLFWPGDGHWNAAGHALAAELVMRRVTELGWLSADP